MSNKPKGTDFSEIVFNDMRLTTREMFLLFLLYQLVDSHNRCYLNYSALMKRARCSFNSLKKYLKHLEEYGYITLVKENSKLEYIQMLFNSVK